MCWSKCNSKAITACSSETTGMEEKWSSNEEATGYIWVCPSKATTVPLKSQWSAGEQLMLCLSVEAGWSCFCCWSTSAAGLAAELRGGSACVAAGSEAPPKPPCWESPLSLCCPSDFGGSACRQNWALGKHPPRFCACICQLFNAHLGHITWCMWDFYICECAPVLTAVVLQLFQRV